MTNPIFEKQQLASLFEELNKANNILIFGHKSPDGDSVGSTLGLFHFLKNKGIKS
ncbi:MAG: DHH family phosphoesterase, partial [Flavobacteriales bacterium]